MEGITPFEAWCGKKPVVWNFRVFVSPTWAHIPSKKCKALEPQSQPYIFVYYPNGVKGYRFLDLGTHDLFTTRSVQFEETSHSSSSPLPSYTTDSDIDSKDFPPIASTHKVDNEVSSSSSKSSDSENEDSPPLSPTMPRWSR
jgi:hypothetical protein